MNGIFGNKAFSICFYSSVIFFSLLMLEKAVSVIVPSVTIASESQTVEREWYPPRESSLSFFGGIPSSVINVSDIALDTEYGAHNWCNEPHVRALEYDKPASRYKLQYVEVMHRHHKRTPYAANTFPVEDYPWFCDDSSLFSYGRPSDPVGNKSASTIWHIVNSDSNPFQTSGFAGNCQFPQLTRGGLDDSWQHGRDLYEVYHDMLRLIPNDIINGCQFRVTNNQITTQVASMIINGMFGVTGPYPLHVQSRTVDSLEPAYQCPQAVAISRSYGIGSKNPAWNAHLEASASLFKELDALSGVSPEASDWHLSWDHYFDNLSSRFCHAKPLPCSQANPVKCVTAEQAHRVFRLGEQEYSFLYREAPESLAMSVASFGVWVAELAQNLREASSENKSGVVYRHNVAHDGSLARLLSILQVEKMFWPGMGAEVVFELYKNSDTAAYSARILLGGKPLRSSHPVLRGSEMTSLDALLGYLDGLVGLRASLVPDKCKL